MDNEEANFNELQMSLDESDSYPRNVFGREIHEHSLKALESQLKVRSSQLFARDEKAAVAFFELRRNDQGYHKEVLREWDRFDGYLTASMAQIGRDPRRRFIFIKAGNSRAPLNITKRMLLRTLTYHQVMPSFMHYFFPFGYQQEVRDFHFMGFRSDSYMEAPNKALEVPILGRYGRHIELCYSLKSVEPSSTTGDKWAIRQCSLHHRFDFRTEQMTWIIVKANRLIQDEIQNQCEAEHQDASKFAATSPFVATLAIHRILATWAGENWHWYINDMESALQYKTRRTLSIPLETTKPEYGPRSQTVDSQPSRKSRKSRTFSLLSMPRKFKRSESLATLESDEQTLVNSQTYPLEALNSLPETSEKLDNGDIDSITFEDFQTVQFAEDQANEASLIMRANSKVVSDLRQEYTALLKSNHCPESIKARAADVERFDQHLLNVEKDLLMQQNRLEALLRVLADRKELVQGYLQFRNMRATMHLAQKAQVSADKMESMTREMHVIAQKTKVETVSMRIITFVTLFFLPGTFISTLMSTPIVKFDSTNTGFSASNIGAGALELYVVVSVPLVLLTFLAWYGVSRWEKRKSRKEQELQAVKHQPGVV